MRGTCLFTWSRRLQTVNINHQPSSASFTSHNISDLCSHEIPLPIKSHVNADWPSLAQTHNDTLKVVIGCFPTYHLLLQEIPCSIA